MQILGIHTDSFRWFVTDKALENPEASPETERTIEEECLVFFIGVEKADASESPDALATALAEHVRERSKMLSVDSVVLYPYVHLVSDPGPAHTALNILRSAQEKLGGDGLTVYRSPFGWYKGFDVHAKGHPLSEWSAQLTADAVAAGKQPGELHRLDLDEVETGDVLMSLHGLSMFHLLQYERLCGNGFEEVVVLGMEPLKVEPGIGLSGPCRERMPALLDLVRDEIHSIRERMTLQGGKVNAGY